MNEKEDIKRVVIYMRVSTDEQAKEGFSLDDQLTRLRKFVESREDWILANEYVDDGYSGRNTNRPAYKKMMADLHTWDMVVVKKMDRIHRHSANFTGMISFLKEHHKEFISQQESWDTSTAMGRFVMDILQRVAQLESEQTGERVYDAMTYKAKTTDTWMGRQAPHGYKYIPGDKPGTGTIKVNIEELQKIRRAFELYAEDGLSLRKLGETVGISWGKIKHLIHNPFYAGWEFWDNYLRPIKTEPIISYQLFDMVQEKLAKNFRGSRNKKAEDHEPFQLEPYIKKLKPGQIVIEVNEKDLRKMARQFRSRHNYTF